MIKRDRASVAVPGSFLDGADGTKSLSKKEKDKAKAYYSATPAPTKTFSFLVYGNDDVKAALEILFEKKCAYCESKYTATQPVDIEHYRPKGRVKKVGEKGFIFPGYWWLAASWENLLPSCIDCNRKRRHKFDNREDKQGKADHFPLFNGVNQDKVEGQELLERPLLIDPTKDEPDDYFHFSVLGTSTYKSSIVKPLANCQFSRLRARESIRRYGLNRPNLAEARYSAINKMMLHLYRAETDLKELEDAVDINFKNYLINSVKESLHIANKNYCMTEYPHSAACLAEYQSWIAKFQKYLSK
jgi:uncharacterized protein (TIGR02646 family)